MEIPIVIGLWEHANFGGRRRFLVGNCPPNSGSDGWIQPDLRRQGFNDITSSIRIYRGPNYDAWKARYGEPFVIFCEDISYGGPRQDGGAELMLTVGAYPNLHDHGWGDRISSIIMNHTVPSRTPDTLTPSPGTAALKFGPIPFAVELFADAQFKGQHMTVLFDVLDVYKEYGGEFKASAVVVEPGPDLLPGHTVRLFPQIKFTGHGIDLALGEYPNLGVSHNFNDATRSIRVR